MDGLHERAKTYGPELAGLTGNVETQLDKYLLEQEAAKLEGVKKVINHILTSR